MPAPKRRILTVFLGLATLFVLFLSPLLRHPVLPRYTVTDLGTLAGYAESNAVAVNRWGDAVGFVSTGASSGGRRAVEFRNGKIISLGSSAVRVNSFAHGINDQGEVTGQNASLEVHQAFVYSNGKSYHLHTLPGFSGCTGAAINDTGEITGQVDNLAPGSGAAHTQAFVYSHGKMTAIGTLPGTTDSEAHSINGAGQVVGQCSSSSGGGFLAAVPFLYDSRKKTTTPLPVPASSPRGTATQINDVGQVAGLVISQGPVHAALWSGGHFRDLGVLPGDAASVAQGLNNQGEVVGASARDDTGPVSRFIQKYAGSSTFWQRYSNRLAVTERAFVFQNGRMQDLNTFIPREADWKLEDAESVNDRGQIVGVGLHHGQRRAFLLTPMH